ncbi:MAG: alpha/beta fold hydrolase [Candidatus Shapirobacteria bacterium]
MKKETIVLLPGYDGNGDKTFEEFIKLINKKYDIVVINYPYRNNHDRQYNLTEIVNFIDEKVKGKVTILGFSMGGFVASKFAKVFPQKVSKLILVSSSTNPILDNNLRNILFFANILLGNKVLAYLLTKMFMLSNIKDFPLPKPSKNFKIKFGYSVFGSLAKVMIESCKVQINTEKLAILFDDDKSFPAKVYGPELVKQGFEVKTFETGGHAEGVDYWEKVAKTIL